MSVNVLHIITSLGEGGAQKILKEICLNNKDLIHEVVCFKSGRFENEIKDRGVKVYFYNIKKNPIRTFISLFILINFKFKPNIIQTWMYHSDLIGCLLKLFWFRKDKYLFWNVRNGTLIKESSSFLTRRIRNILSFLSFFSPNKIIYCSKSVKLIHESVGYNNKIGEVINNGVDTNFFHWYSRENRVESNYKIGFIGRFNKQKNLDTLFQSLSILKKENIQFSLYLVGENLDYKNNKLKHSLKKADLINNTNLYGIKSDIRNILFKLDLLVLTSTSGEGFPNILLEAMSTGLRCISTDVGESKCIINKFGWIIKPKDIESLVNAIKKSIYQNQNQRIYFEKESRNHVAKFYPKEIMIENYKRLYTNTIN